MDQSIIKRRDGMWNGKINGGYTLLEMLLVMFILLTITFMFPLLFTTLEHWVEKPTSLHPFEWEVATRQLTMDVREAQDMKVENGKLTLMNEDTILYELYGHVLRRRVNQLGHEVTLQNIQSVQFFHVQSGIKIQVKDLDGTSYEEKIYTFIQQE